jgi:large subunit ribosomal protein L25
LEQIELNATVRKTTGNSPARELRRGGQIPAVLYGPQTEPILLSVDIKALEQIFKRGNIGSIILNLVIQNGKKITKPAMIKELQSHPVSGNLIHIDFYEIDMQRKINVMIPVVTKGRSKGVESGGMDVGDSVHIEEIPMGDNVELLSDVNFTVVTILSPKMEEEAVEEEEEEALEGEEAAAEDADDKAADSEEED